MSSAPVQLPPVWFANDSSRNPANARTLRALVALRNQEIAERIKALREGRGNPPQPVVAAAIGVSLRALQKYEAGDAIPRYHNLGRLAEYYGVTESYILEGVDNRPEVQGVPEQLSAVDGKFSDLVQAVVEQLERIETTLQRNEQKLDRLMHLVDAGLFLSPQDDEGVDTERRQGEPLRGVGLGAVLARAFQENPEALEVLVSQLPEAQAPPRRSAGRRSRAAK